MELELLTGIGFEKKEDGLYHLSNDAHMNQLGVFNNLLDVDLVEKAGSYFTVKQDGEKLDIEYKSEKDTLPIVVNEADIGDLLCFIQGEISMNIWNNYGRENLPEKNSKDFFEILNDEIVVLHPYYTSEDSHNDYYGMVDNGKLVLSNPVDLYENYPQAKNDIYEHAFQKIIIEPSRITYM